MRTVIAVDIGGTKLSAAVVKENGEVLNSYRVPTNRDGGPEWMVSQIENCIDRLLEGRACSPEAIGIGFGGPVDYARQEILDSLHVQGWGGFPLVARLRDRYGLPCVVDNDANTGALGEARYGAGRRYRFLLYYTVSTGVGGGIIIDGKPYRGANSQAGELGHVPIHADGPECTCGFRGCVESLCSGLAIARRAKERLVLQGGSGSRLGVLMDEKGDITAQDVFQAAAGGDPLAAEVVEETRKYLVAGIVGAVNVLDPEVVIIGGGVSLAGDQLFRGLTEWVSSKLVIPGRRRIPVLPAGLKGDSVLLGAAALATDLLSRATR